MNGATNPATLPGAVEWLTGVLAETRADLARIDPGTLAQHLAQRRAAGFIADRLFAAGATVHLTTTPPRMTWRGITVSRSEGGLPLFDAWLAKARARLEVAA